MIFRSAPIYPGETPLRRVCNVFRMNFLSRLLRDVKGVGCKIEKDWKRGGYGWRIIVDGRSTDETPPDWESPFSADSEYPFQVDSKFDEYGYFRIRGGMVTVINSDGVHVDITYGTPYTYGDWISASDGFPPYYEAPYYICIVITYSSGTFAVSLEEVLQSAWPVTTTNKWYYIIAADNAPTGTLETPQIVQMYKGGHIVFEFPKYGTSAAALNATSSAGTALTYSRSDHTHQTPSVDMIRTANDDSDLSPTADYDTEEPAGLALVIGTALKRWATILMTAYTSIKLAVSGAYDASIELSGAAGTIDIDADDDITATSTLKVELNGNSVDLNASGGGVTLATISGGDITLTVQTTPTRGYIVMTGLPTSNPGGTGRIWSDGGTLKIT